MKFLILTALILSLFKLISSGTTKPEVAKAQITDADWRETFKLLDKNGDEKISKDELRDIMSSVGDELTDEELTEMIRNADTDGNGYIDLQEFVQFMKTNTKGTSGASGQNQNDEMKISELKNLMKYLDPKVTDVEVDELKQKIDPNGTGKFKVDDLEKLLF